MIIKFREGSRVPAGVTPEATYEVLDRLRRETGGNVTPKLIVEAAEPKGSPIHPFFEWRNGVAAQRYREYQARQVARIVVIQRTEDESPRPSLISTIRTGSDGVQQRVYDSAEAVVQRPDEWLQSLHEFNSRINTLRRTLETLERFASNSGDNERLARIAIAAKSLDAAISALQ